jgi:hypothetical protein
MMPTCLYGAFDVAADLTKVSDAETVPERVQKHIRNFALRPSKFTQATSFHMVQEAPQAHVTRAIGAAISRLRPDHDAPKLWEKTPQPTPQPRLVIQFTSLEHVQFHSNQL